MSDIVKRKFKCTGCGEDRPCFLETNQESGEIAFYDHAEDLKCVLDTTNQTSYNWEEVQANEANKNHEPSINYDGLLADEAKRSGQLFCGVKGGFCQYEGRDRVCTQNDECVNQIAK